MLIYDLRFIVDAISGAKWEPLGSATFFMNSRGGVLERVSM
jgi:hypothetical protein